MYIVGFLFIIWKIVQFTILMIPYNVTSSWKYAVAYLEKTMPFILITEMYKFIKDFIYRPI